MERIGDFSKRCEVTIKALRWYDKLGLLLPDFIDKYTGYRYYSTEKVAEMHRITELKDIGFSLEEIKRFCSAEKDCEKYQVVWQKRQELEKLSKDTAQKLNKLSEIEEKLNRESNKNTKGEHKMKNTGNYNNKFENDEAVVGRWETVGAVAEKENFIPGKSHTGGIFFEEIYFLPDGGEYWIFSWTKGYVKLSSGEGNLLCRYETEEIDGELYMFMEYQDKLIVLKRTDTKRYTKYDIGQYDDIDLPFVNDENVIGKWSAVDFVREIDDFSPSKQNWSGTLFYKSAEFLPGGELLCEMSGTFRAKWTKGAALLKTGDGATAPAYEIRDFSGKEYLFIEWKSGDYIWGKRKPCYYVFERE